MLPKVIQDKWEINKHCIVFANWNPANDLVSAYRLLNYNMTVTSLAFA